MPHLNLNVGFTDPNWPDYGYPLSPILQEIRRERRIELAGEGFRFDDLCRWKAGHLLDNVKTYIGKKLSTGKYAIVYPNYTNDDLSYQEGKSRKWDDKMYLYPIATGELQRNPQLLPQNPGWRFFFIRARHYTGLFLHNHFHFFTFISRKKHFEIKPLQRYGV